MIRIYDSTVIRDDEIFARSEEQANVAPAVKEIIAEVRKNRDSALLSYTEKFDHAVLSSLRVSEKEIEEAVESVDPVLLEVMSEAAENIAAYHEKQIRHDYSMMEKDGVVLGQRVLPLERVGVYVPGGTAAYPSTVLMDTVPARLAGVKEIIMVTPPGRDGKINPNILAAAYIAGVSRIYKVGGAQAIAALAYGTESIPAVDKIVGPGNAYVAEAKKQVFGQVGIDMVAGPSEVLIIADAKSNPRYVAADLLSQAEHDRMASAVLITDSAKLAEEVQAEIEAQLKTLEREEIARASIDNNGKIIVTADLKQAAEVSNRIAPEHLELCVEDPFAFLSKITNAGSVFLGRYNPEPMGDYFAGPNHTLPTMGTARFYSPLGVDDFVKKMQFSYFTKDALAKDALKVSLFARAEGLTAHARAVEIRFEDEES